MNRRLIITCEHAGNEVPKKYRYLFHSTPKVLQTHQGYDIGALELTETISNLLKIEAHIHTVSRLLIDLNRSLHNPSVFSKYMDAIEGDVRRSIIEQYYLPHRQKVQQLIVGLMAEGQPVLHLSVHTFTPTLKGNVRNADIGFLYDPVRTAEVEFCRSWKRQLQKQLPELKYRMNYPYLGTADGFTAHLRKKLYGMNYAGIELEVNQKFAESADQERWSYIQNVIAGSLQEVINK